MDDTIRRQTAIDSIMEEPSEARYPVFYAEKLKQLPPAQSEPDSEWRKKHYEAAYAQGFVDGCKSYERYERQLEQKRGKWIYLFDNKDRRSEWGCLRCSHIVYTDDRTERPEDRGIYYCPHCCSDNREENDNEVV